MKKSIRLKLFAGIIFLISFFVLLSGLLNTKYLEKYYLTEKTRFLIKTANKIDNIYEGTLEDINAELESLERNAGVNIIIINSQFEVKYASFAGYDRFVGKRPDFRLRLVMERLDELKAGQTIIEIIGDPRLNTNFLNLLFLLKNKDYLALSIPIAAIQENAAVANKFFFYTGLLTILIGSILAYFFAKQFSQPILELNGIAQGMARLDFSRKYNGQSDDELGELGKSINILSEQLSTSITNLQAANEKLKQDIARERRIDEMRKEFISSVSHELKTPITLIQGYAEGLKVGIVTRQDDKLFYCDVIMDEAGKMNKLVTELLDLSQLEKGYFQLEKNAFNLSDLLERLLSKYQPIFSDRVIIPQVEKPENLLVYADPVRTEQILVNYLNNALNHLDQAKLLIIKLKKKDQKARASVFNSGKTIPEEALDKVFESFYKIDRSRTRAYGGTGLGLSVVRAIQELDKNAYGVANRINGVEFWFEVDLAE